MSSAVWAIASMKKSIMFDVLGVMDRANKTNGIVCFDYSLLKADTVKKYNKLYSLAKNDNEVLKAALYAPVKKPGKERFTILYELFIDKAFEFSSFAELINWIKDCDKKEIAYYIAARCLSANEITVNIDDVEKIIEKGDTYLIDALNKTTIPEKVKMSVYLMIYNYKYFIDALIEYLNVLYKNVAALYSDYYLVIKDFENILAEKLQNKQKRYILMTEAAQNKAIKDGVKRKQIFILSLIRLEYSWIKYEDEEIYYIRGLFFLQRMMHDIDFMIF